MSRVIKFRAWHPLNEKMISFHKYHDKERCIHLFDLMANKHVLGKDLLMQFTGLQDKNGADIYEGDIVYCHDVWYLVVWEESKAVEFIMTEVSKEKHPHATVEHFGFTSNNTISVVGNIHQNPELLA